MTNGEVFDLLRQSVMSDILSDNFDDDENEALRVAWNILYNAEMHAFGLKARAMGRAAIRISSVKVYFALQIVNEINDCMTREPSISVRATLITDACERYLRTVI
jgi:hypothetical protein